MTADLMRRCITAAVAAPSIHNTQPWLFRIRDHEVDVLVDRRRQLQTVDPDGREMHLSVGAAIFNLRVALAAHGHRTNVTLAPSCGDPSRGDPSCGDPSCGDPSRDDASLAATVRIGGRIEINPASVALLQAVTRRRTNRRPFADIRLPLGVVAELRKAAALEGGALHITSEPLRTAVLSLARTADRRLRDEPGYRDELAAWTTPPGIGRTDGVPRSAFGPRAARGAIPMRDLGLGHGAPATVVEFEPHPTLALLYVPTDDRANWLRAGAALQRVWLTATIRGVALTPLTQAVEIPDLRDLLADTTLGPVQALIRLGYPLGPTAPVPRRPLEEVLIDRSAAGQARSTASQGRSTATQASDVGDVRVRD